MLVDGRDPSDFASAVLTVLNPETHAAISGRARERAVTTFGWDGCWNQYQSVIDELTLQC
jgi:glycosyltransferase involved in cell wall biosynthesis